MEFNATFIVAFISFVIFIIIMNQILYKPINQIIEKRQKLIDDNYNDANNNIEKSKAILDDRLNQLKKARDIAKEKTSSAIDYIKKENQAKQKDAKEESKRKIEENINALNQNEQEAIDTLKNDVINLAQIISDKFIETSERIENIDEKEINKIMQD